MTDTRPAFWVEEKGFTLIEIMITIVVVSVVLLGFISANSQIQKAGAGVYERSVALQDANRVVELLRNAAASGTFPSNVTGSYPDNGTVSGFSNLSSESVLVDYVSTTADPLDVTVTVSWQENGLRSTSVAIRTLITQRSGS